MNRFARPLVLYAVLDLSLVSTPADVLTIAQSDIYRQDLDRALIDMTADGRYITFTSYARLVPADANDRRDVYVLDRTTGSVTLESLASDGLVGRDSGTPSRSDDGRFLVYETHLLSRNAEPIEHCVARSPGSDRANP
jgi:hypothetical protein